MHEHDRRRTGRHIWARRTGLALVWLVLLGLLATAATVTVIAAIRLGSAGGLPARQRHRRSGGVDVPAVAAHPPWHVLACLRRLTIKVGGKVFAWIPLNDVGWLGQGARMAVKLPADVVTELQHTYPGQVGPARPLDQRYWVTIPLAGNTADGEICELLTLSYHEVVARLPRNRRPIGRTSDPVDSTPAANTLRNP